MESFKVLVRKLERPDKILAQIGGIVGDGFAGPNENPVRFFIDKTGARHEIASKDNIISILEEPQPKKESVKSEEVKAELAPAMPLELLKEQPTEQVIKQ